MAATTHWTVESYFATSQIEFTNDPADPDGDGSVWLITDIKGWYETPPTDDGVERFSGRHGGVRVPTFYGPRQIIMSGVCIATSTTNALTSRDKLGSLMVSIQSVRGRILAYEGSDTRRSEVYAAGPARMSPPNGSKHFEFEIPLVAPDPRKYGDLVTETRGTPGGGENFSVTNSGNIETWPTYEVVQAGTVSVTNLTDPYYQPRVYASQSCGVGTIFDFYSRQVYLGLVNQYDKMDLNVTDWWAIQPGSNDLRTAGTELTLTYRHAYI